MKFRYGMGAMAFISDYLSSVDPFYSGLEIEIRVWVWGMGAHISDLGSSLTPTFIHRKPYLSETGLYSGCHFLWFFMKSLAW